MPFINLDFNEAKEPELLKEGEYALRIVKAEDKTSKNGSEMTAIVIEAEGQSAASIRHWLVYPDVTTPPDQRGYRLLDIKRFLAVFGVPFEEGGFNSEDLVGATGTCLVVQEANKDTDEVFNRLRLPRLRKGR